MSKHLNIDSLQLAVGEKTYERALTGGTGSNELIVFFSEDYKGEVRFFIETAGPSDFDICKPGEWSIKYVRTVCGNNDFDGEFTKKDPKAGEICYAFIPCLLNDSFIRVRFEKPVPGIAVSLLVK